jgi:hypothetical protein
LKWDLTPEQKKLIRRHRLDRIQLVVGQSVVIVFGLVIPIIGKTIQPLLPFWLCMVFAGIGLVLILTTKASQDANEKPR